MILPPTEKPPDLSKRIGVLLDSGLSEAIPSTINRNSARNTILASILSLSGFTS